MLVWFRSSLVLSLPVLTLSGIGARRAPHRRRQVQQSEFRCGGRSDELVMCVDAVLVLL